MSYKHPYPEEKEEKKRVEEVEEEKKRVEEALVVIEDEKKKACKNPKSWGHLLLTVSFYDLLMYLSTYGPLNEPPESLNPSNSRRRGYYVEDERYTLFHRRDIFRRGLPDVLLMYMQEVHKRIKQEGGFACYLSDTTGIFVEGSNIVAEYLGYKSKIVSWYILEGWMRDPLFWFIITKVMPACDGFMKHKSVIGGYRGNKLWHTFKLVLSVVKFSPKILYNSSGLRVQILTYRMREEVLNTLYEMSNDDIYKFVRERMNDEYAQIFKTLTLNDIIQEYGVISNYPPNVTTLKVHIPPYIKTLDDLDTVYLKINIKNPHKI